MIKQVRERSRMASALFFDGKNLDELCDFIGLRKAHGREDLYCDYADIHCDINSVDVKFGIKGYGEWLVRSGNWLVHDKDGYYDYNQEAFSKYYEEVICASSDGNGVLSEEVRMIDNSF